MLESLLAHLTDHGVTLSEFSKKESFAVAKQWTSIFGRFKVGTPHKHGLRAVNQYLSEPDDDLILLFLSSRITAFPLSTNHRPCSAFRWLGESLDLSAFHDLEFALFPNSYAWTIVHTHEDGSLGGPYFIRADDIRD